MDSDLTQPEDSINNDKPYVILTVVISVLTYLILCIPQIKEDEFSFIAGLGSFLVYFVIAGIVMVAAKIIKPLRSQKASLIIFSVVLAVIALSRLATIASYAAN